MMASLHTAKPNALFDGYTGCVLLQLHAEAQGWATRKLVRTVPAACLPAPSALCVPVQRNGQKLRRLRTQLPARHSSSVYNSADTALVDRLASFNGVSGDWQVNALCSF